MYILVQCIAILFASSALVDCHSTGVGVTSSSSEINIHLGHQRPVGGDSLLYERQACGAGAGSCPEGQCCSAAGQCGTGSAFCAGPDCQLLYGPACDGNVAPPGVSTLDIARPLIGDVPYGQIITQCTTPGTVALTFDDGPYEFTQNVLDILAKHDTHATFFITGNNLGKGRIDDPSLPWVALLKKTHDAGHQIAQHTWSHQDLTQLPTDLLQNQIIYNEMALRNIFGWIPTYMRPPFGFCDAECVAYMRSLGYHVVTWNLDTKDYLNDDPSLIHISQDWFSGNVSSGTIELSHDTHLNTAMSLVTFMLETVKARGLKAVSVGECLGDPIANWYRDAGGIVSSPSPTPTSITATTSSSPLVTSSSTSVTSLKSSTTSESLTFSITASSDTATTTSILDTAISKSLSSTTSLVSSTSGTSLPLSTISRTTSSSSSSATSPAPPLVTTSSEAVHLRNFLWVYGIAAAGLFV